jgi:hypothetical protein
VFINSINNVKRFFKDDAGDYKPIRCVAATLNNSVLHKTHLSCDETVKYFFCKQSKYFFMIMFALFLPIVNFAPMLTFLVISFRIYNITMLEKAKQNTVIIKNKQKQIQLQKSMINQNQE